MNRGVPAPADHIISEFMLPGSMIAVRAQPWGGRPPKVEGRRPKRVSKSSSG